VVQKPYSVGQSIGGYTVERVEVFFQVQGWYIELRHSHTNARHIHVACEDDNNGFMVTFPTLPTDDTGVAHILEHMVLNGSENYPARSAYANMRNRSLCTFRNAFTFPDLTTYPFSTRNQKDFANMMDVYLDFVFFPSLTQDIFLQEGWRYQFKEANNSNSPLEYAGVVFNEMKGAMANPVRRMYIAVMRGIFPDLVYRHNAGGEPHAIPDLTWQAIRDFHATYYHPSNAYFYTYGSFALEPTLERIESQVLTRFSRQTGAWTVNSQPRFTVPRRTEAAYAITTEQIGTKHHQVLMSWLLPEVHDGFAQTVLQVLERVFLGNAASPIEQALLDSGLGSALADFSGIFEVRETVFSAGLKDVKEENIAAVETLILETLRNLVQNGLDADMVDAAIHQIELNNKDTISDDYVPFALNLGFKVRLAYTHGGDPFGRVQLDTHLERLARERQNPRFLEAFIQTHFLENPHRVTTILRADPNLNSAEAATENTILANLQASLNNQQKAQIIAQSAEIAALQSAPQDLDALPTLEIGDIPTVFAETPCYTRNENGVQLFQYPQPTQGLAYLSLAFDVAHLSDPEKAQLAVLAEILPKLGAGNSDHLEMAKRIERTTGGVKAMLLVRGNPENHHHAGQWFSISSKMLYRNQDAALAIVGDFIKQVVFEPAHLRRMLGVYHKSLENRLLNNGQFYAMLLSAAQVVPLAALREQLEGVSHVRLVGQLCNATDAELLEFIAQAQSILQRVFRRSAFVCVSSEPSQLESLSNASQALLMSLPATDVSSNPLPALATRQARGVYVASTVGNNAATYPTVPFLHPDAPALVALGEMLGAEYIRKEIREKGGAYGGHAGARYEAGYFAMFSYRDPHIQRTFETFAGVHAFLEQPFTKDTLKEAILGACKNIDPLLSPSEKGEAAFFDTLAGYTLEKRNAFKARLLAVTEADLRRVAQTYLHNPSMASVAGLAQLEEANAVMGNVFDIQAV
jgi:presequence protease